MCRMMTKNSLKLMVYWLYSGNISLLNDPLCLMDKTVIQQNILNLVRYSKNIIYYVYMDTNKKKEKILIGHKLCTINSQYTCTFICYVCTCMSRAQHAHVHILYMYIYMLCVYVHVARAQHARAHISYKCTCILTVYGILVYS